MGGAESGRRAAAPRLEISDSILYARASRDVVVVRVRGRGSHLNGPALRQMADTVCEEAGLPQFVFDLEECTTLDSTFMGVLASIALRQRRERGSAPIVTNLSRHVRDQLDMLGLKYILDMRSKAPPSPTPERFEAAPNPEAGKLERIVLMIEAHERLIDVDRGNEVRFRGVIQGLRDSLDRARSGGDGP